MFNFIILNIVFLSLNLFSQDSLIYARVLGKRQSIQLSSQLIAASQLLSAMAENTTQKKGLINIPYEENLIDDLHSYIYKKEHLNLLPKQTIEQLYLLSNFLALNQSYHEQLARVLWSEYMSGHEINKDVLSHMKQYLHSKKDQALYNEIYTEFFRRITPRCRSFYTSTPKKFFVGEKYIGFCEKKDGLLSAIYPQFIAHFMRLNKIFDGTSANLENEIREKASISIPLIISNLNQPSFAFRDDPKGFTLVECKKNGALHRYENGLKTYYSNFENMIDVCCAPPFGYYLLYKHKYGVQVLFFEFGSNEKKYALRKFFPYRPWFVSFPLIDIEKPCIFLGWDSVKNTCKLLGINKNDSKPITYIYKCEHSNCCPLESISSDLPPYNSVNQRNCLQTYSYCLPPTGFYSHTPNGRLWLANPLGNLMLYNLHEDVTHNFGSYNDEEAYFLSNTILLLEKNQHMTFWDMKRFYLIKERFEYFLIK